MTDIRASIEKFFDSYTEAFNKLDLSAVEQHYTLPALLVHKHGQIGFEKPPQIRKKIQSVIRYYRDLRYKSCHFEILGLLSTRDDFATASLKWIVKRDAPLPDIFFQTTYNLRKLPPLSNGLEWAITTVISFDEPGLTGN